MGTDNNADVLHRVDLNECLTVIKLTLVHTHTQKALISAIKASRHFSQVKMHAMDKTKCYIWMLVGSNATMVNIIRVKDTNI